MRKHIPVGFVIDNQIEDGHFFDYPYLFIVSKKALSSKMKAQIKKYEQQGGKVIYNEWTWETPMDRNNSMQQLIEAHPDIIDKTPVQLSTSCENIQVGSFSTILKDRLVVNLLNDYSWVERASYRKLKQSARLRQKQHTTTVCRNSELYLRIPTNKSIKLVQEIHTNKKLSFEKKEDFYQIQVPQFEMLSSILIQLK